MSSAETKASQQYMSDVNAAHIQLACVFGVVVVVFSFFFVSNVRANVKTVSGISERHKFYYENGEHKRYYEDCSLFCFYFIEAPERSVKKSSLCSISAIYGSICQWQFQTNNGSREKEFFVSDNKCAGICAMLLPPNNCSNPTHKHTHTQSLLLIETITF